MEGINHPAAADCGLTEAPCGNRTESGPLIAYVAGESYFVTFQKNLNHFDVSHPGYFAISFLANITEDGMCNDAVLLAKVPDTSDPSLTLYTVKVIMPTTPTDHGVLQAVYTTDNPKAPPDFYQCADIKLVLA